MFMFSEAWYMSMRVFHNVNAHAMLFLFLCGSGGLPAVITSVDCIHETRAARRDGADVGVSEWSHGLRAVAN